MAYTVYTITTINEDKVVYVGKTKNFDLRAYQHYKLNSHAKEWIAAIGTDSVSIDAVAEFDTEEDALKCEDALILKYDTITNGYNKRRSGLIEAEDPQKYHSIQQQKYQKTEKGKEYHNNYNKEWQRKHRKTEEYREKQRLYRRDYRAAKKLGISVAEYREIKKG